MDAVGEPIPAVLMGRGTISDERRRGVFYGQCDDAELRIAHMIRDFDYDTRDEFDALDGESDRTEFASMLIGEVGRWYDRWRAVPLGVVPDFLADPHEVRIAHPKRYLPSRTEAGIAALVSRLHYQCIEPCTHKCKPVCDVHADYPASQDSHAPRIRFRVLGSGDDLRIVLGQL